MKKIIRTTLIYLLSPLIKRLGYIKADKNYYTSTRYHLDNLINLLKNNDFEPNLIIDVGAHRGTWSRVWKHAFRDCTFILVEPQYWLKPSCEDLLDGQSIFLPIGVGKEDGTLNFTIDADRDDSSTFTRSNEAALEKGYKQMEVPVKTLNTIVQEHGHVIPDMVKIDAEGLDLDVLNGASNLIGKTEIFFVEASINSDFKETDLLTVIRYMDQRGYRVFDITALNRPSQTKILWLVELVFIRKDGYLDRILWEYK